MKQIAAIALVGCLTSCATSPPVSTSNAFVTQAQQLAVSVCGFLPAVETITSLFISSPSFANAQALADAVCRAVVRPAVSQPVGVQTVFGIQQARMVVKTPRLNGVSIKGQFVR